MKRQAERRDSSPSRALAKRIREREREREARSRAEELQPPPPLALLLAESRGYHRRSRSREREKPRLREGLREERAAAAAAALELHRHELSLLGRPPLRTTPAELPGARPGTLEYKTLLISNLGSQVSDEDVEDMLFHEFKKFGDVSVKLSHTPELGRIAYVNFRHPEYAKEARHAKSSRLVLGDRQLKVEPMYVRKRSVTPPDVGYLPLHAPYPYRQRSLSPPGPGVSNIRDLRDLRDIRARQYALESLGLARERERILDYYGMLDERGRPYGFPPIPVVEDLKPEDDQRATSNLFIGNLEHNVQEVEIRRSFEKYGIIEDVVIKRPVRGQGGAYAFVKYQNLDMALRAKVAMQGRLVIGGNPVKIGYGKANPTTRLWVGGLGPGTSLAALAREFDRFGSIRNVDYVKGDTFAYIQYESLDAAQAACGQMRGFPLGGPERRLRVDFAKVEETPAALRPILPGFQPPVTLPTPFELLAAEGFARQSMERELRGVRDRLSPPALGLLSPRERERALLERDFPGSPPRTLERRLAGSPPRTLERRLAGSPPRTLERRLAGSPPRTLERRLAGSPTRSLERRLAGSPTRSLERRLAGSPTRSLDRRAVGSPPRGLRAAGSPTRSLDRRAVGSPTRSLDRRAAGSPTRSLDRRAVGSPPRSLRAAGSPSRSLDRRAAGSPTRSLRAPGSPTRSLRAPGSPTRSLRAPGSPTRSLDRRAPGSPTRSLDRRAVGSPTRSLDRRAVGSPTRSLRAAGSPTRGLDRRAAGSAVEAFGRGGRAARSRSRSRERWLKEREERRNRRRSRSTSNDRQTDERERDRDKERGGRAKARGAGDRVGPVSPDASPDRARVRAPDSTTEPRDHSPDSGGGLPRASSAANDDDSAGRRGHHHHHHKKSSSGDHLNNHHHRNSESGTTAAAGSPSVHTDSRTTTTSSSSSSPLTTLAEFATAHLSKSWHGFFALKNSSFPADLYMLEGGPAFFSATMARDSLKPPQGQPKQLKIAQRLRMDQTRLDEVTRRVKQGRPAGYAVLLALQGPVDRTAPPPEPGLQVRLLRHLVTYLRNKEAAGVISLPATKDGAAGAMLYVFPPGEFSQQYLTVAKRTVGNLDEEHMVIVIVRDTG